MAVVAAEREYLILDHLDLVQHAVNQVSSRYPSHVDRGELWNAGALGLVEAAARFREEAGVPFPRYAATRIKGAIIDSTRQRDWAGRAIRRNTREIRRAEEALTDAQGRLPSDPALAAALSITDEQLRSRRNAAAAACLLHLDYQVDDEDPLAVVVAENHPDCLPEDSLLSRELSGTLRVAVAGLPEPQREVVERYYFGAELLQDIAASLGVTEARTSQICAEALNALRSYFGAVYEGVPQVPADAPGKRSRAAYVATLTTDATWRTRIGAAASVQRAV
ncbi:MAG TPA: sigma-70 family RNA polymerase sigma factor [Actinomycetota bacterium]|nr:sigma-70 family RNA polymerase sigma factor [Actinomycetota bacterium]